MAGETRAILYGYWLSSCTWRVRAALNFKRIPFEEKSIDIVKKRTQLTDEYRAINPSQKVPALVIDNITLVESMAILQYLEETRASPSLVPHTPLLRARMREICEIIVSGIQPLQNLGLKSHFDSQEQYIKFTRYWTDRGLQTLEELLQRTSVRYCVEDQLSMADLCLVPQLYNAVTRNLGWAVLSQQASGFFYVCKLNIHLWLEGIGRQLDYKHQLSLENFPTVSKIYETLLEEKCIIDTHPESIKSKF